MIHFYIFISFPSSFLFAVSGQGEMCRNPSALFLLNSPFLGGCSHAKDNSFYSSSDSEDDDEPKKFHVEIKPVQPNNGTHQNRANIDELKASIGNIILSPSTSVQLPAPNTNLLLPYSAAAEILSTLEGNSRMSNVSHCRWECHLTELPFLETLSISHSFLKLTSFTLERCIMSRIHFIC